MRTRWGVLLLGLGLFSACTVLPTGPSVLVLPAVGKPMDVFQVEEGECRAYAQPQLGVAPEQTASAMRLQGRHLHCRVHQRSRHPTYRHANPAATVLRCATHAHWGA